MILVTAIPAAPRPITSTRRSSRRRPVSFTAFSSAAITTTAVPCWSSWKTGMSSSRLQALLDLEAARRGDVLEVDPAEAGRDQLHRAHDLVGVLGVEADREGVDAGELLEQARLALHHRHRRRRADVAEAEHRGAVGDDRHRVALDRVLEGLVGVVADRRCTRARRPGCRPSRGRRASSAGACCAVRSCRPRAAGRCGRSCRSPRRPASASIAARILLQWSRLAASTTMSRTLCSASASTRSTATTMPPGLADRARSPGPRCPGASSSLTRIVSRYCALGVMLTELGSSVEGYPGPGRSAAPATPPCGRRGML